MRGDSHELLLTRQNEIGKHTIPRAPKLIACHYKVETPVSPAREVGRCYSVADGDAGYFLADGLDHSRTITHWNSPLDTRNRIALVHD
jgi:hypothetical protein